MLLIFIIEKLQMSFYLNVFFNKLNVSPHIETLKAQSWTFSMELYGSLERGLAFDKTTDLWAELARA